MRSVNDLILSIDQGTTSTRCVVYDRTLTPVASVQREHRQILPRPGWVEHDAAEIWRTTAQLIEQIVGEVGGEVGSGRIAGVGITNQRETVVLWDRATAEPVAPAIVWQDTRTRALCEQLGSTFGPGRFRERTGLPISTYFSGPKIRWLLDQRPELRAPAERGDLCCGTIDSWLLFKLAGVFRTDATNASRTLLMDLRRCAWNEEIAGEIGVPLAALPEIVPSFGAEIARTRADGPLGREVPIAAVLGDQQAALVGQGGLAEGATKCTYGTGCFLLRHTGARIVRSGHGLLSTVAALRAGRPATYALEGSIAIGGSLIQWLRDQLQLVGSAQQAEELAGQVEGSEGVVIVPAFSGLFAPYWRSDARGIIGGLTRQADRRHLCRAALEAVAWQVRDVLDAMTADAGSPIAELRVDGGMVVNELLMQIQADALGIVVTRARHAETTALGAALAAGLTLNLIDEATASDRGSGGSWRPAWLADTRERAHRRWKLAVERSMGWQDADDA